MFESVILGIVQGLTEFIPVSSTAHLVILPDFFGWSGLVQSQAFDVALHFGTTLALILFFWRDWLEILTGNRRLLLYILAASVPVGLVGLTLKDTIEATLRTLELISAMLIIFGMVMLFSERARTSRGLGEITLKHALFIGIAQVLALIPGVSRSGVTISAGLLAGYRRHDSARFSFLLSTPAIVGATLLESRKIAHGLDAEFSVFAAGFLTSVISGYLALAFLMGFLRRNPVNVFVYYRFFLAAGAILFLCLHG